MCVLCLWVIQRQDLKMKLKAPEICDKPNPGVLPYDTWGALMYVMNQEKESGQNDWVKIPYYHPKFTSLFHGYFSTTVLSTWLISQRWKNISPAACDHAGTNPPGRPRKSHTLKWEFSEGLFGTKTDSLGKPKNLRVKKRLISWKHHKNHRKLWLQVFLDLLDHTAVKF